MEISFVPLTPELTPACQAFNERLRGHAPFPLPETASPPEAPGRRGIAYSHYVAVDQGGAVRGGVLLIEQRGWLCGREIPLINPQSPLSEGIVDRRFSGLALEMLRFLDSRCPYLYALGMGGQARPYPRMLKAGGWSLSMVPFYFSVVAAGRFLREIGPLRSGMRRAAAQIASRSGAGAMACAAWQLAHRARGLRSYRLEPVTHWPECVEGIWEGLRGKLAFATMRDREALEELYPQSQPRLLRWVLRRDGAAVGWSAGVVTAMDNNAHFGNLQVGTILDGLAAPEHLEALIALTHRALAERGAELILSNQTLPEWQERLRRLGFLEGPSNYVLALSRPIAAELNQACGAAARVHVNRGDGEGRLHL